ncbi:MAG: RCC1 domain-containing protein [Polyangiales bacterium]
MAPESSTTSSGAHLDRIVQIACTPNDAYVLTDDGHVGCFSTSLNPCGRTRSVALPAGAVYQLLIDGLIDEAQIAVDWRHGCSRRHDGTVRCWGFNSSGQLGDGTTGDRTNPVSVAFLGGFASQVAIGDAFSCALLVDGRVRCWGSNARQQLGDGTMDWLRTVPGDVPGAAGALWIATGSDFACAGMRSGRVRCWGANEFGQLGDGTTESRSTATDAIALQGARGVSLGDYRNCAFFERDEVKCWGGIAGDGSLPKTLDLSSISPTSPP